MYKKDFKPNIQVIFTYNETQDQGKDLALLHMEYATESHLLTLVQIEASIDWCGVTVATFGPCV